MKQAIQGPPRNSILWVPLPIISWIFPPVGHLGVSDSSGASFEFAGPYFVPISKEGRLIFGWPTRYLPLDPTKATLLLPAPTPTHQSSPDGQYPIAQDAAQSAENALRRANHNDKAGTSNANLAFRAQTTWDSTLQTVEHHYNEYEMYNILTNNCHAFVSSFLNMLAYRGRCNWNQLHLATMVLVQGRFTSLWGVLQTWLPFCAIIALGGYFGRLIFLYCWLGLVGIILGWYCLHTCMFSGRKNAQWQPNEVHL